ncbi:hypothetical protein LINPERHAP2_LOCUS14040, partial [Linum perenne]
GDSSIPLLLQVRRQPHRRRNLPLHRHRLRSNLLDPDLPHQLLQVPKVLHRQGLQEARDDEDRHRRQDRYEEVQVQEDQSRRDLAQGVEPRPLALQVQVRSGRRIGPVHRLRAPQLSLRREGNRQAPLPSDCAREEDEPQGTAR